MHFLALFIIAAIFAPTDGNKDAKTKEEPTGNAKKTEKAETPAAENAGASSRDSGKSVKLGAKQPERPKRTLEEALAELDGMVGLAEVKAEIHKLVDYTKVVQARKKQGAWRLTDRETTSLGKRVLRCKIGRAHV